jgi:hypothetical protein
MFSFHEITGKTESKLCYKANVVCLLFLNSKTQLSLVQNSLWKRDHIKPHGATWGAQRRQADYEGSI